ncbi:hypothetical protein V2A60_007366 [Cordyceps javanica]|uniref:Uncharacterized protein n=1 Tax=Cordyceps javanica TaxID=43265 RepID=A0A545VB60_9HYPO|nr:hypothetical protein IF1G_03018 [Cordyceps javanica]TQW10146.1 hypothetical protein IF2G_02936 [Cordyceps javanica]
MDPSYGHSRTRTTSSSIFPSQHHQYPQQQQQQPQQQQQQYTQQQPHQQQPHPSQQRQQHQQHHQYTHHHHPHQPHQQQLQPPHSNHHSQHHSMHSGQQHHHHPPPHSTSNPQLWRRSPSIGAFSNASSYHQPPPAAYRTSTSDLRRSTSSRSAGTQAAGSSYVALLRKQKATVWCERAQYEDPRVVAQQRAAKMRANLEVVSGNNAGRTQTGLASAKVAGKIRHGKAPVVGYAPGETHVGVGGVPLRLSAREIDGDGSDDDDNNGPMAASRKEQHHRRAGSSGRSSTGSGRQAHYRTSGSGTPARNPSLAGTPERSESLANKPQQQQQQQHKQSIDESAGPTDDAASGRAQSSRSGNSERRDDVLELGQGPKLAHNSKLHSALTREKSVKSSEELKRRGSVDERTSTLTSGRLFIANPD